VLPPNNNNNNVEKGSAGAADRPRPRLLPHPSRSTIINVLTHMVNDVVNHNVIDTDVMSLLTVISNNLK